MANPGPSGQRLRDLVHEQEILRSGQNVCPGMIRVIDCHLNRGEDLRDPLHLVDDGRCTVARQKAVWIISGEPARLGVLQIDVLEVGKDRARKGSLPGLARAGQGDYRIIPGIAHKQRTEGTSPHVTNVRFNRRFVTRCGQAALAALRAPAGSSSYSK